MFDVATTFDEAHSRLSTFHFFFFFLRTRNSKSLSIDSWNNIIHVNFFCAEFFFQNPYDNIYVIWQIFNYNRSWCDLSIAIWQSCKQNLSISVKIRNFVRIILLNSHIICAKSESSVEVSLNDASILRVKCLCGLPYEPSFSSSVAMLENVAPRHVGIRGIARKHLDPCANSPVQRLGGGIVGWVAATVVVFVRVCED